MEPTQKGVKELDCADLAVSWVNWKREFMVYMIASGKSELPESKKIALFLWQIGSGGVNIYNTLFPNDGSAASLLGTVTVEIEEWGENEVLNKRQEVQQRLLDEVIMRFDEHCLPQKNVTMESFKFSNIIQREKQPFTEFLTELRSQLDRCDYKCRCGLSYEERMLKDRIITGVVDKKLQLKLLDGNTESVGKIIDICRAFEAAGINKGILDTKKAVVAEIAQKNDIDAVSSGERERICFRCGGPWNFQHRSICKAKNATCNICMKKGHFASRCRRADEKTPTVGEKKRIAGLNWDDNAGTNSYHLVRSVKNNKILCGYRINSIGKEKWTKEYVVLGKKIKFKIDTGADVNCIPLKCIKRSNFDCIKNNNEFKLYDYSNNPIKVHGKVILQCFDTKLRTEQKAEFIIVDDQFEPILGRETCSDFNIIQRIDANLATYETKDEFIRSNSDLFTGLGKFPEKVSIQLKENSVPVLHYKKRVPIALLDKLKLELLKMEQEGIISRVDYPTDWVNNLQIVEKPNGKIRICLDPKPLNACIKREHFLIPTIDDMISNLGSKKIFSVLDLSSGFWHMELDEVSSNLTTFMTPMGRYKFNRAPFGLSCCPEIFQKKMLQIFGNIKGVMVYFDDIAICAENVSDHDSIMESIIKCARENNIKFNPDKFQYKQPEITFMGHLISEGTVKPNIKYKEAILGMKKPQDKSAVLRFLGLLKYIAKFIPNLSKLTAELRHLTRTDVPFQWNDNHDKEFQNILAVISSDQVLAIYDPNKNVIIQTDASKDGLGCVIIQEGKPVAFASRTLSKSEQKWAQIEKELLAVVFACQRFHFYLYGRSFIVESDHKPLETLIKRNIDDVTMRLQRMFMALLKYPQLSIIYKPGKDMLIADCLSRAQLSEVDEIEELSGVIHSVTKAVCISEANYNYYRTLLNQDERYKRIYHYVENGWPGYHQLDEFSQKFYKMKSELHVENEVLFWNHRLVIPSELQLKMIKWLHLAHLGIEKTLARARSLYYWPGMNAQIREMIQSCGVCEKFTRNNQKEQLSQDERPRYPYHIVAMDLFEYAGRDFISIIDSYSNFLVSIKLNNKTSGHIIEKIQAVFNQIGYPTVIRCDNSPFGSSQFAQFANKFNIEFRYSSPRYAQSNGLAEKGVAIAKNIIKRCFEANKVENIQFCILEYNTTPVASLGMAPSELFFGRLIKGRLPMSAKLLVRNNIKEQEASHKIENKREVQKYYYDRNAKNLPQLCEGDNVIFKKNSKDWVHGTIIKNCNKKSYIIKDGFHNHFRRNRRFIVKSMINDFSASDLLFEETLNLSNNETTTTNLKEIEVIPRTSTDSVADMNDVSQKSTGQCETAQSESEESGVEGSPPSSNYRTRSGREVRPTQRYGWD